MVKGSKFDRWIEHEAGLLDVNLASRDVQKVSFGGKEFDLNTAEIMGVRPIDSLVGVARLDLSERGRAKMLLP